jgi:YD repeat-containing protein
MKSLELTFSKILLFVFLIGNFLVIAQNNQISEYVDHYSHIIPETPNASTFTKYGGTSLNLSKGIPNINIPLYNISIDGVTIPISMSYDASGIKTNDLATAVGLKWRLNTGGGIFRSINNMADDSGWLTTEQTFNNDWFESNPHTSRKTQLTLLKAAKDYAPDNFFYSINNYSNSFIFKQRDVNTILKNKNDNFKLTAIRPLQAITSFKGQDVNGNSYHFGSSINSREFNSTTVIVGHTHSINNNESNYVSSWLIDQIKTKNNHNINFEYVAYNMDYTLYQQSDKVTRYRKVTPRQYFEEGNRCGTLPDNIATYNTATYIFTHDKTSIKNLPTNKLISKIYTDNIEVNFIYADITANTTWKKKLTRITIVDKITNTTIKEFDFLYELYTGDNRLKLKEIKETIANEEKPPYVFTYNDNYPLPNKNTFSRDIFGYYNGANNLSSAIPFTPYTYAHMPLQLKGILADRRPNFDYLIAGNLEEIQYPTGVKSILEYELNQEINGLGMDTYEEGGFNYNLGVSDFSTSNGAYKEYTDSFTVPENTLIYHTYLAGNNNITSNILYNTSSNAKDYSGNICNDPNVGPNIDCSHFKIYDMDNNGTLLTSNLIGKGLNMKLPAGNYKIVVLVKKSELLTPNLLVKINFKWYREFLDNNGVRIKDPHYVGGLRIKKTKDIDTNRKIYNETEYEYSNLIGQSRSLDDYSKLKNNGEYIMSSDFIRNPKLIKSGYFYGSVITKKIGEGANRFRQIIKSKNTFANDFSNNSYESKPKGIFTYDKKNNMLGKILYNYNTNNNQYKYYVLGELDYCYDRNPILTGYNEHSSILFNQYENRLVKEVSTQYFFHNSQANSITRVNEYNYNSDELISIKASDFRLEELENLEYYDNTNYNINTAQKIIFTNYKYPKDYPTITSLKDLVVNKNILAIPISIKTRQNKILLSGDFFEYDTKGNIKSLYNYNKGQGFNNSNSGYIPANYDLNSIYRVNDFGNPVEVSKKDGTHVVYIWGYNHSQPIAKIENASYFDVQNQVSNLQTLSNNDNDRTIDTKNSLGNVITYNGKEGKLREALQGLRNALPNAQVTTYTYDPLIGVTSMTNPRGETIYYTYDTFNRLEFVKDADGNILTNNQYNYKN